MPFGAMWGGILQFLETELMSNAELGPVRRKDKRQRRRRSRKK